MRIAFISYECPPDNALGGIGTYILQAASALAARGHYVEIFSASPTTSYRQTIADVTIHRRQHTDAETFGAAIAEVFSMRHAEVRFDVLEGPEYMADAAESIIKVPEIPMVVKLHAPTYLVSRLSQPQLPFLRKWRVKFGAWRRGIVNIQSQQHSRNERERLHTVHADSIVSPSQTLARLISRDWKISLQNIRVVANIFTPSSPYLSIKPGGDGKTITFVGRLERLKGVLDLAAAIPLVLKRAPQARFRFVGRSMSSPIAGMTMEAYLRDQLKSWEDHLEFTGAVPPPKVPELLASAQLCVLPSLWENFPYACLEAMSASRAVVATSGSGYEEMIGHKQAGILVPPRSPRRLAKAILQLINSPEKCVELGKSARNRVLTTYSAAAIIPLQEASYQEAIEKRRALGPRPRP